MADETLPNAQEPLSLQTSGPSNPFDDYGSPDDSSGGLKEADKPSYVESFKINAREGFKGLGSSIQSFRASRTVKNAEDRGVAQPGDSPFAGKPSQAEVDAALGEYAVRKAEKAQYDSFESDGFVGKTIGLMGGLAGGIVAPENFISAGGSVAVKLAKGAQALGVGSKAARIIGTGAEAGAVNLALDVPAQALDVASGLEKHYNPWRSVLAFGAGQALGSGMAGIAEHLVKMPRGNTPALLQSPDKMPLAIDLGARAPEPVRVDAPASTETPKPIARATTPIDAPPARANAMPRPAEPTAPRMDGAPVQMPEPAVRVDSAPPVKIGIDVPQMQPHRVSTAAGNSVDVAPVVVEAASLKASADAGYDPALQPRDRDRAASQTQIREMSARLDPERLGVSAEADRGAPIVGSDGMVESGNGRVMAIRQAYQSGGETAQRYRDWVSSQGVDVSGFKEPVIVRQRLTDMTPEQRQSFTVEANQSATLSMSAGERALADARALRVDTLDMIRNADDLGAVANRDFMKAFVQSLPQSEQGMMSTAAGGLSSEGMTRVRNAVLARAYGNDAVLARIAEATSDDVKSISNALVSSAPEWAKFRADVESGSVRADMDLTPELLEAVSRTADIRAKGVKLDTHLAQQDAFDRLSAPVESWMRMFYDGKGRRAAGTQAISERLTTYAREARKVSNDAGLGFDLPDVRAQDIQLLASKKAADDAAIKSQTDLFNASRSGNGAGGENIRPEAGRSSISEGGKDVGRSGDSGAKAGKGYSPNQITPDVQAMRPGGGRVSSDVQPMAAQARTGQGKPNSAAPDNRFPDRPNLPGETGAPREFPKDATPNEVRAFRLTDEMRAIAESLGRKVEVDGRFTAKGALGEYKLKDGVIRVRKEGDFQTFSHEVGHVVDQRLRNDNALKAEWTDLQNKHIDELRPLDLNNMADADKTLEEGLAEFLRMAVNNPAYAEKQAPNFFAAFKDFVEVNDPALKDILQRASRVSQIDSSLTPTQLLESQIVSGIEEKGLAKYAQFYREQGLGFSLSRFAADAMSAIFGESHYVKQFVNQLRDARYEKTGQPLPKIGWGDPYKMHRMLPGAVQTATDGLYYGVRSYHDPFGTRASGSLHDAISKAFNGDIGRLEKPDDPLTKAFSSYLIARRGRSLYERWKAGDLENPPLRASENEVLKAIADYEATHPQFKAAADGVFEFNRAMFQRKFDSGIISKEIYDTIMLRGDDYVPYKRDMRDDGPNLGMGAGASLERSPIKKMRGSTRDIIDPLHSIIADTVQTERIIAQNDVMKAMYNLAKAGGEFSGRFLERIPNNEMKATSIDLSEAIRSEARARGLDKADTETILRQLDDLVGEDTTATIFKQTETTARGERVMFMWESGERIALKVGNNEVSKAYFDTVSAMTHQERDILFKIIGKANSVFSQLVTNAPQFATKNLVMDNISRIFIGRNTGILGRVPGASIGVGIWTQLFDREFTRAYAAVGGIRGGVSSAASRELQDGKFTAGITMRPRTMDELKSSAMGMISDPKSLTVAVAKTPFQAINLIVQGIEATETMGRLGQAKIVHNHLRKQGYDNATAFSEAAFEARDILDYDNKGWGVSQSNRVLVFLNPNLQGMKRANDVLLGDPFKAIVQKYKRGGMSALDGDMKQALADAVSGWGMISLGLVATAGYYYSKADDPTYQRQSDYMKRRYFIFNAGVDADGTQRVVTMPKPFDLPGTLMSSLEISLDGMRRQDPANWAKMRKAFFEGFVPRQAMGFNELISGNPFFKTGAEVVTGTRIPFEDKEPSPIIPMKYKSLPPEAQQNEMTSYLAKKMGAWFGISPMMADHVMNGLGATTARDANNLITAVAGENPNVNMKDAMLRMTVGGLYRKVEGPGGMAEDFQNIMGRDHGKYTVAANGYSKALTEINNLNADDIYNKATDNSKTLMTMRAYPFKPDVRQLHPLERASTVTSIFNDIRRDLGDSTFEIKNRSRKKGQEKEYVDVPAPVARAITNTLGRAIFEEYRNALTLVDEPGYKGVFNIIDTSPNMAAIRALSPETADEIEKRLKKAHVLPFKGVADQWPEVKKRLLADQEKARLGDLRARARMTRD